MKMLHKLILLTAALIGLFQMPIYGQDTTDQSGSQEATVSGTGNTVNQTINNTIIYHPGRGLQNRDRDKPRPANVQVRPSSDRENQGNHYGQRKHDDN
jgi:hypothetical protein